MAVVALGLAGYYVHAVYLFPFKACRACAGSGTKKSGLIPRTHRECRSCGSKGRHKRWLRKRYEKRNPSKTLDWGERYAK